MGTEGPAQTFNYMLLGYAVILACLSVLVVSMIARWRTLKRDLARLQDLERRGRT